MSGAKQEVVEGIGAKIAEWGKKQLGNMGKPLEILDAVNPTALQRVAGGAVLGGGVGAATNIATGIAGSVLSPVTGGMFTDSGEGIVHGSSFGVGSVLNSAMKGAAAGGLLFGAGFKTGAAGLEMRSGLRAFSDMAGDMGAKLGLGVSRNAGAGARAVEGKLGSRSIRDSFSRSARFVDKGDDLANGLAGHRAGDISDMSRSHRSATNKLNSQEKFLEKHRKLQEEFNAAPNVKTPIDEATRNEWLNKDNKIDNVKALRIKQEIAKKEGVNLGGRGSGQLRGKDKSASPDQLKRIEETYEARKSVVKQKIDEYNKSSATSKDPILVKQMEESQAKANKIDLENTIKTIKANDITKLSRNEDFLKFGTLKAEAKAAKAVKVESNQSVNKIDPQTQTSVNSVGPQESIKLEANKAVSPSAVEAPVSPAANQPVKSPGYFSKKWDSAKKDPMKAVGASLVGGGLAMTMYQTNALGINIPSNRGYR